MTRRELLKRVAVLTGAGVWGGTSSLFARHSRPETSGEGQIMTVRGPIAPGEMGAALPHEHILSRFGKPPARRSDYDLRDLFDTVVPVLNDVKSLGCEAIMDCTAAYFGRDPLILKQLAELTGLHLLTNTGYYGAADDQYIPDHAYEETADQLAERWRTEWTKGVDKTGIRPGFIKTAIDGGGSLSEMDAKLVRAAARTHKESGLTIAVHTSGNVTGAREQLSILDDEGVAPSAWIWVHAQNVENLDALIEAGKQGAWIEFDNVGPGAIEEHIHFVETMRDHDLLDRVLLSHDGSSYPPEGAEPRPYDTLFRSFLPEFRSAGFREEEVHQLTVENPRQAFTVRVRT